MNKRRGTIVALAFGALVLGITTGWSTLAGGDWPPEPYAPYSPEGAWIETSSLNSPANTTVVVCSPVDQRTGVGTAIRTDVDVDPTMGGLIPDATSWSSWFYTYVRIGPNSGRVKGIAYVKKDQKPRPAILGVMIVEFTSTMTASDAIDYEGTGSIYSPTADKDGDGQPDADETPLLSFPIVGHMKRI